MKTIEPTLDALKQHDIEHVTEEQCLEMFRDSLNDAFGTVSVCGYDYASAYLLEEIDPTAFRCGLLDWLDSQGWDEITIDKVTYYVEADKYNDISKTYWLHCYEERGEVHAWLEDCNGADTNLVTPELILDLCQDHIYEMRHIQDVDGLCSYLEENKQIPANSTIILED